jgi:shikimate kinase
MSDQLPERAAKTGHNDTFPAFFLVGFMGAGKSSVGLALAAQLAWKFVDLDERIVARESRMIADIFRDDGEAAFRKMEALALIQVIEEVQSGISTVIALGGGAYVQPENEQTIRATGFPVVFLDATLEELRNRCAPYAATRPLFQDEEKFRQLYESRRTYYLNADFRLDTTAKPVETVVADLLQILGLRK